MVNGLDQKAVNTYWGMVTEYREINRESLNPSRDIRRMVRRWGGEWNENTGGGIAQGIVPGDGWHIGVTDESIALWDQPGDQPYQDLPAMEEYAG